MTRYYRTSYGYKSYDGDFGGAIAGFLAIAIVLWFFSALFIPLVIILVLYIIYYFCSAPRPASPVTLIVLSTVTTIAGFCFFMTHDFTPEKATAQPKIEISVSRYGGFFEDSKESESWTYADDIKIEISDNVYYLASANEQDEERITIRASEDADKASKEKIKMSISGGMIREDVGDSISLDNSDFRFGETKIKVTASNSAGEVSKTITVNKISVAETCAKYDKEYSGDFTPLVDSVESYCVSWKQYEEKKSEVKTGTSNASTGAGADTTSSGEVKTQTQNQSVGAVCSHYEAGRCWDDLEMEAYSQGMYDKTYGRYGDSYYESDDCDAICQDILADAYDEGYADGY